MCFSAEASFTAAAALAVAGGYLVKKFLHDKKFLLALTPCLFAIQQFSEGVVWMALTHDAYPSWWGLTAQGVFLFFALAAWPLWIPIAFFAAETSSWRRIVMAACIILGVINFSQNIIRLFEGNLTATIVHSSINYGAASPLIYRMLYAAIALVPIFISSIRFTWIVGLAIAIAFAVSDYLYHYAFTSVWCFFSAVIVISLLFILKKKPKSHRE